MNKVGVIVSGGDLNESFAMEQIREISPQYLIAVDKGLLFFYRNHILPTHIVGDFDSLELDVLSYYKEKTKIPIREFDPVKDASDTEIGIQLAIEMGVEHLWILGATGTRLDHVMANIQTLYIPFSAGVEAYILDPSNRISLHEKKICLEKEKAYGKYFSIFPFDGSVSDVTVIGAKYPLEHYALFPYDSRCVSNEYKEDQVDILFPSGKIILMETKD